MATEPFFDIIISVEIDIGVHECLMYKTGHGS